MPQTSAIKVEEFTNGLRVNTGTWMFEHHAPHGGACTAIVLVRGTSGNLLNGPITSAIRCLNADGTTRHYRESYDTKATLRHEVAGGATVVIAEGVFRDESGANIPVGYRRRTEYHAHGLIWSTLEIMSDCGCPDVIELCGASVILRRGMTHCSVRLHPTQAGGADLLGAGAEFSLVPNTTAFLTRFTPLQIQCVDRAGEGMELFPGSDLAAWDYACKSDVGLGFYRVAEIPDGTQIDWMPYCMAQRRATTVIQGKIAMRLGMALPALASRLTAPQIGINAGDEALKAMAASGTKVVCCAVEHGADAAKLSRVVDAAHAQGLKIVAKISAHELHPAAPEFAQHGSEWMHSAAPSLGIIKSWRGNEVSGGLMCLQSGWLDFLKREIDALLTAQPWDGVCLDAATPYPCCHPGHGRTFHSDREGLLSLLAFCRERVGAAGLVLTEASTARSFSLENLSDGSSK